MRYYCSIYWATRLTKLTQSSWLYKVSVSYCHTIYRAAHIYAFKTLHTQTMENMKCWLSWCSFYNVMNSPYVCITSWQDTLKFFFRCNGWILHTSQILIQKQKKSSNFSYIWIPLYFGLLGPLKDLCKMSSTCIVKLQRQEKCPATYLKPNYAKMKNFHIIFTVHLK